MENHWFEGGFLYNLIGTLELISFISLFIYVTSYKYQTLLEDSYYSVLLLDSDEIEQKDLMGSIFMLHLLFIFPFINVGMAYLLISGIICGLVLLINTKTIKSEIIDSYMVLGLIIFGLILSLIAMGSYKMCATLKENIKEKYSKVKDDKDLNIRNVKEFKFLNSNDKHEHSDL